MSRLLRRLAPMLILAALLAADWTWRHFDGVATPAQGRSVLLRSGLTCGAAAIFILVRIRPRSADGLGHIALLAAVSGLFVRLLAGVGPQPTPEWERDMIHAGLDVGPPLILIGVIAWEVREHLDRTKKLTHPGLIFDRRKWQRRRSFGRRKDDRT